MKSFLYYFFYKTSLRQKLSITVLGGSLVIIFSLVSYAYVLSKDAMIDQIKERLQQTTENAEIEINRIIREAEEEKLSVSEIRWKISERLLGPISDIHFEKVITEQDKITFLNLVGIAPSLLNSLNGENGFYNINYKENSFALKEFVNSLSNISDEKFRKLIEKFSLRVVRDLSLSPIKMGKDGYVMGITSFYPEWQILNTSYPEDYTLEAIKERFSKKEFDKEYLLKFGDSPQKIFDFIQNYMRKENIPPNSIYADFHPFLGGNNIDNAENNLGEKVGREIAIRKNGWYSYSWKNPTDKTSRYKLVFMKQLKYSLKNGETIDWVLSSSAYEDDVYIVIKELQKKMILLGVIIALLTLVLYFMFFKWNVHKPLDKLLTGVKKVNEGDISVQVPLTFEDEIGYLTASFNSMVKSIANSQAKLEEYALELENKVKARTYELQQTLEKVQELKLQQDGDYFLTSVLLKTLTTNKVESDTVKVEHFIKQKKQFQYKKWHEELGGDICISHSITLSNKKYVVFVNADAMGKSIQGAGGAIVFGSVFESIIERTSISTDSFQQSPERWLKNSFIEIHKVFESFSGSMYISAFIGLVDEATGLMYYINGEHPSAVLYRDGVADFFKEGIIYRKLGMIELSGAIFVDTLQLKHGDIILVGSDGKDDILIGSNVGDEKDFNSVNEDETLFLRIVEKSNADLQAIYENIQQVGQITDDLSIVKVSYLENLENKKLELTEEEKARLKEGRKYRSNGIFQEAERVFLSLLDNHPNNKFVLRELLLLYMKNKDFSKLVSTCETYSYYYPNDNEVLLIASYALKKIGQYQKAIDYGERIRLRNQTSVKNLLNLCELYIQVKKYERAGKIIKEIEMIEPSNKKLEKLKIYLKRFLN